MFTQKEQQKTFINRVVGNQIFLNTRYKRTLFILDKIPVFSLQKLEIDSIVYELLFDLQASPNKKKNGSDWEGLAFAEKIVNEETPQSDLFKSLPKNKKGQRRETGRKRKGKGKGKGKRKRKGKRNKERERESCSFFHSSCSFFLSSCSFFMFVGGLSVLSVLFFLSLQILLLSLHRLHLMFYHKEP